MAGVDTSQYNHAANSDIPGDAPRVARMQRLRGRLARCAAGVSTLSLSISVTTMAMAQDIFGKPSGGGQFKAAPKPVDPEDAAASTDMILGIHVNTIFFVVAAVIGVFWFTLGGGRKPKVARQEN